MTSDAWVVLLGTKRTMRCNVAMSQTIEHARVGGVYGQTSLDSAQVMFGWQR